MRTVELKLAHWKKVYGQLNEAELRLREAASRGDRSAAAQLQALVHQLQRESNGALDAVHAALAARGTSPAS